MNKIFINNLSKLNRWWSPIRGAQVVIIMFFISTFSFTSKANCLLDCRSSVEIALFSWDDFSISPFMVLNSPYQNCPSGSFSVKLYDANDDYIGTKVNPSHIGQFLTYIVTNTNTGQSCGGNLRVVDNMAPIITTSDIFIPCSASTDPLSFGYPDVSDNISQMDSTDLTFQDYFEGVACFTTVDNYTVSDRIKRIWKATDDYGNEGVAVQNIYYVRQTLNDITFPSNRDGFEAPFLSCATDDEQDLSLTGTPEIQGESILNAGHCEFAITYSDNVTINCIGDRKILRTWLVTDWCLDSTIVNVQVIKVRDTIAPIIVNPDTLFLNTSSGFCSSTVELEIPESNDDCSAVNITAMSPMGSGFGPFSYVQAGSYEVIYSATDECGNTSTASGVVVIKDNEAPIVQVKDSLEVQLSATGIGTLKAIDFNNNSFDNCGIASFEIKRAAGEWNSELSFNCFDLGEYILVELKATDAEGHSTIGFGNVFVEERILPSLEMPLNTTIACIEDVNDLTLTGAATASDNCALDEVFYTDVDLRNDCGIGLVERTWFARDSRGNIASAIQQINIADLSPLNVIFPDDFDNYECGLTLTPDVGGRPIIENEDCENLEISYSDQTFQANQSCHKIIRNWTVIDWCNYPQNGGIWNHTQTLMSYDTIAPILNLPARIIVGTSNEGCEAEVIVPPITATDCNNLVFISNNSQFAYTSGADISGVYPRGEYRIEIIAEDGCGNQVSGFVEVAVIDDKAPTPVCHTSLSISLNTDGNVSITPSLVVSGVFDNCSEEQDIALNVNPSEFTCLDIGEQEVEITAVDQYGNVGKCQTTIIITDQLDVCAEGYDVSGLISTLSGSAAVQVPVGVSGPFPIARQTDVDGSFVFEKLPKGQSYTIVPVYDKAYHKGISTYDLVILQKHILRVELFQTPYQWIAADANNSGTVSTLDLLALRKLVLRVEDDLPNNTSWRFIDAAFQFTNLDNPLEEEFPEFIQIDSLTKEEWNNDFIAVKIGDLNASAKLNTFQDVEDRSVYNDLIINVENDDFERGDEVNVVFQGIDFVQIEGFQFALKFDAEKLRYSQVETKELLRFGVKNIGLSHISEGLITISWNDSYAVSETDLNNLFVLKFTAKEDGKLSDVLNMDHHWIPAEAYRWLNENARREHELLNVKMKFLNEETLQVDKDIMAYPNPFSDYTRIVFNMPCATISTLTIHDVLGNVISRNSKSVSAGMNDWIIDETMLKQTTGLLFYSLESSCTTLGSGKLLRSEN